MNTGEIVTYTSNARRQIGFFKTWMIMAKNIIKSKDLIIQLFRRDFFMVYKKSFLGFSWLLISPIIGIASWVFMNQAGILQPGNVGIPYPAFVLLSSSIWGLFMGFYTSAAGTLGAGSGFIMQVKYPHEALLVKQTAQHLANFLITFGVNIVILLIFGIVPHWSILLLPILTLPLFFLGAGMGLITSVISVVATDVSNIFNILLSFAFYVTPIIYSSDKFTSKLLQKIIEINPLSYLIGATRDMIIYGRYEHWDRFAIVSILSVVFFMISWRLFFVSEDKVIEKMI
jgi:lipopolysaccharide transport system permease protein